MGHIGEVEQAPLGRHLRVERHLQQQVAQLVAQLGPIAAIDRIGHFVSLFDRVGRDRGEILLHVPRATALGIAQPRHDREQVVEAVPDWLAHGACSRAGQSMPPSPTAMNSGLSSDSPRL